MSNASTVSVPIVSMNYTTSYSCELLENEVKKQLTKNILKYNSKNSNFVNLLFFFSIFMIFARVASIFDLC